MKSAEGYEGEGGRGWFSYDKDGENAFCEFDIDSPEDEDQKELHVQPGYANMRLDKKNGCVWIEEYGKLQRIKIGAAQESLETIYEGTSNESLTE